MDYQSLAETILQGVGGKENVRSVVHCATRLRFTLKDTGLADTQGLSKVKGVMKVVNAGGQYQIVIGPDVPQVYRKVLEVGGLEQGSEPMEDPKKDDRSYFSRLLESIAGIFQPIIPAITGAGLLKAMLALCSAFGWIQSGTPTAIILNAMADSAFYFLPILLAMSCGRKFRCNQGTAMALAGLLVYPSFITLLGSTESVKLFDFLPITRATYTSSVIPIILGVWFMSGVEHFVERYCPRAVKFFFVPFFSLTVGGIITISLLGPIGAWASNGIQWIFNGLKGLAPWLVPTVVGAVSPLLVMTGTHYGLIPIGTNNLGSVGHDAVVGPGMLASNTAQGAAGLAVALRSRNPETRQQASSAGLTGILGITEPVLYGVNLRLTFPLYAAMIGGAAGGLFMGLSGVERFGAGSPGLLVLPVYIPNEEMQALGFAMNNLINAIIGVGIAMLVSFLCCLFLYGVWERKGKLPKEEESERPSRENEAAKTAHSEETGLTARKPADISEGYLAAPLSGQVLPLSSVSDEVFSSETMGPGVAILPEEGRVIAPCDGVMTTVFPTGHALGITGTDGVEVLIHVGVDTVTLEGEGFYPMVSQGDTVKRGTLLLKFDLEKIRKAGLSPVTPIVISNSGDYHSVTALGKPHVTAGEDLLRYEH